ncbi:MAG: hypothetical protein QXH02_00720 [Desulfurococcaceae archaeon]
MSIKVAKENLELLVGIALLFSGWLIIFLVVIRVFHIENPDLLIAISLLCYALSLAGLALTSHGLVTMFIIRRKKRRLAMRGELYS